MDVESRATALLRGSAPPLLPLRLLHRSLVDQTGAGTGDVAALRSRLHARPDLFVVLERPLPLAGAEQWPEAERSAYEHALREAGFESDELVGMAAPNAPGGEPTPAGGVADPAPAELVARALAQLASAAPPGEALRARLADSLPLAQATMRVLEQAWRARNGRGAAP
jgi:hypothetical protein